MEAEGLSGPVVISDGAKRTVRLSKTGELIVGDGHSRFYEACQRGTLFSGGMGLNSISAATYGTGTLGATVTPIIGLYNPIGSVVNLAVLQAALGITVTAATATGGSPFVWATTINTGAITVGNLPFNRRTLQPGGGSGRDMTNVAPTNMTPNLVVRFASALTGGNLKSISSVETAIGQNIGVGGLSIENFDGGLLVPPGGLLVLLATTQPVGHSAASAILWEEVAI